MSDTNMRRTMRKPDRSTPSSTPAGPSYPAGALLNTHVARPGSPLPTVSKGRYASTDRSQEARAHRPSPEPGPATMRFTSASAAVAAARVLTAHESAPAREPRRARPSKQGRHFAQAKDRGQPAAAPPTPASTQSGSKASRAKTRAPAPVSLTGFRLPIHGEGIRTYGISGEGVRVGTATPPRTPTVLTTGRDVPGLAARFDSAPGTPDGYTNEAREWHFPREVKCDASRAETSHEQGKQPLSSFDMERREVVSLREPEKWAANVTAPLPKLEPKLSRPVLRAVVRPSLEEVEKRIGSEQKEKTLKREGSLKRIGKVVGGVFRKGHGRSSSAVDAGSRPETPQSAQRGSGGVLKRSGSFVGKALDFFAPDRHEVIAAGKGHGIKGRVRVKAGLPVEAGSKTRLTDQTYAKDSLESAAMEPEPRDEEIWAFSREMSDRLESMEKQAEAAKLRDEEYHARKKEAERKQAVARPSGSKDRSPKHGTESVMTTMSVFINAQDGTDNRPPPMEAPLYVVGETGPDPRLIWKEIDRAQGRKSTESTPVHLAKALPELPERSEPDFRSENKKKEQAGMFGMSYLPTRDFQKPTGRLPLPRKGSKSLQHRFSCGSDLSFADCGAPDTMEDCLKCGLVPSGAHILKNGLCAKCTHPALRDEQQKAALCTGDRSSDISIWPRGLGLNRNTTYSDLVGNPFIEVPIRTPQTPTKLAILPEAEATNSTRYEGGKEIYVPARANWRRASTSEDVRLQPSRNTAFYGFYEELLPDTPRENCPQPMTRRPTYY